MNSAKPAIRRAVLPANRHGRDFVVGDLHGCYGPLEQALTAVEFDTARDRLISVGDLVDRGPESLRCLALLDEPWFHAVLGNHEAAMLAHAGDGLQGGTPQAARLHMAVGGEWLDACWPWAENAPLQQLMRRAAGLPHLLRVGDEAVDYHVVHAQLPVNLLGRRWTDKRLEDAWTELDPTVLVWSRSLFTRKPLIQRAWQKGLSPVFCGHTPGKEVRIRQSHVCLDTGLVYGWTGEWNESAITLAEPGAGGVQYHRFELRPKTWVGTGASR